VVRYQALTQLDPEHQVVFVHWLALCCLLVLSGRDWSNSAVLHGKHLLIILAIPTDDEHPVHAKFQIPNPSTL
jgi:hypothetical protein